MSDQNLAILIGTLLYDGEQRYTAKGKPVCGLKLETTDDYGREGHRLTFWGELPAGMVAGARVRAEGKLTARKWKNKEGVDVATVEINCDLLRLVADHDAPLPPEVRALVAGVAGSTAAQLPASEPGEVPTVFPPFGRKKGQRIAGAPMKELEWYLECSRRSIADPSKARWRAKETALLAALEEEIATQRGCGAARNGGAAQREGSAGDDYHRVTTPAGAPGQRAGHGGPSGRKEPDTMWSRDDPSGDPMLDGDPPF